MAADRMMAFAELAAAAAVSAAWRCSYCRGPASGTTRLCSACQSAAESRRAGRRLAETVATIPPAYQWATLDSPDLESRVRPASAIARARAAQDALSVVLVGPSGSGKTSLATAILVAAIGKSVVHGRWVDCRALARARRGHPLGRGEAPAIEEAMSAPIALLDELGVEEVSGEAVQDVIRERHAHGRRTIYATPLGAEELRGRYGDGVARRILERSVVIRLGGHT